MDRYSFSVRLTPAARELLGPNEVIVLDWHRLAVCCAGAGETSLYAADEGAARGRKGLVRLKGDDPIYAARAIFPHLAGREVSIGAHKTLGFRRFFSDLPGDFGLRAVMGRLPGPESAARQGDFGMEGRDRRPVPAGEGSGLPCYAGPTQLMPQHGADAAVEDHRYVVGGDHFQVAEGFVCLPEDGVLHALRLGRSDDGFHLEGDALRGRVALRVVSSD